MSAAKLIVLSIASVAGVIYGLQPYLYWHRHQNLPPWSTTREAEERTAQGKLQAGGLDVGTVQARARAAVLGAFVADAATMPLHWIYNVKQIEQLVAGGEPAFHDPPACPFYHYPLGVWSPYGDEALPLLTSLTAKGDFDGQHFTDTAFDFFSKYQGRLNHATQSLVDNVKMGKKWPDAGVNDDQAHGLVKVPALVARFAGLPGFKDKVAAAVRAHQDNELAVELSVAAAQILEQVVLGSTVQDALLWGLEWGKLSDQATKLLKTVFDSRSTDHTVAVQHFGQSCHLPGSFQAPLHCVLTSDDYASAIRKNILAGGDNCSRAHLIGALFAAQDGWDSVPKEWKTKATKLTEVEAQVDMLMSQRAQDVTAR